MAINQSTPVIPIACNPQVFSKQELEQHVALSMEILFQLPKDTTELEDGFLFEYRGTEELFSKVARFVAQEHRCCPWESFSLEIAPFAQGTDGAIRLRYITGVEGKPFLLEAFEQLRSMAADPNAQQRLTGALADTSTITPANQGDFYARLGEPSLSLLSKLKSACGC